MTTDEQKLDREPPTPKTFFIFKAEDVYKVAGNTKEDIWVSHPVGPFALMKPNDKELERSGDALFDWLTGCPR